MSKAGRRRKIGVSTPPILRTCSQAQRTKQDAERPPTGQARGTKRAALRLPFCARAARLEGQQNRRTANGQGRQEAKKGVSTPPISAYAAKTKGEAKPQNSQWSRPAGGVKKGSPRPQFYAPAAKPKGQVYHYITITLYHCNMIQ